MAQASVKTGCSQMPESPGLPRAPGAKSCVPAAVCQTPRINEESMCWNSTYIGKEETVLNPRILV